MKVFMNTKFYFNVCVQLIRADLTAAKQIFVDKFIDLTIWIVLTLVVMSYIMPFFGLTKNFGVFQLGSSIAAAGLFELFGNAVDLVTDFEGDRTINYHLTLPIPSWLAIISKAFYYAILYFMLAALMLPIGKLCLWNQLDLTTISYGKFLCALTFQSIFFACLVLWAASTITNIAKLNSIWARYIFPMWYMGGFQFSWLALFSVTPTLALINLLNPMIYITEAMRAAVMGQEGFIHFWLCIGAMVLFSVLALAMGMRNLKRRLDFV